ncbi:MAG: hypothetical protein IJ809_01770 [Clostridia bacterium]|nr:hypothetical protein [Clostridia bacterium]
MSEIKLKFIGRLNKKLLGKYANKISNTNVILTDERLEHILSTHKRDYNLFCDFLPSILDKPDFILDDNKNLDTIILLKKINVLDKYVRVVVKLACQNDRNHPNNSIITMMELNDRTWHQTLKNRGNIIFQLDKCE